MKRAFFAAFACGTLATSVFADSAPVITNVTKNGSSTSMQFPLYPATKSYTILSTTNLAAPFHTNNGFALVPYYTTNLVYGQPQYIVDNPSATLVGTWTLNNTSTDKYGADYRYKNKGSGSFYVQFTPSLGEAGDYYVYEWHPQGSNRTIDAPHIITHAAGTTTFLVNQQTGGGAWNVLGKFTFNAGVSGNVKITDGFVTTNGTVVLADAIRFVGVGLTPQATEVISIAGYEWRGDDPANRDFHKFQVTALSSNEVLTATVLNRLAYGPTPGDLETLLGSATGAQDYINAQLAPETILEDVANSHANIDLIRGKLANPNQPIVAGVNANLSDLRAWHTLRAVGAKRQLLEILLQFLENHFVTQYQKSVDYFDPFYDDGALQNCLATQWEFWENQNWRAALLNPACTFYDLLKISAESPAMIAYLDTVSSRGDGGRVANENYARELFELFTFGVDNGYDQNDIVESSKCWTGWRSEIVDPTNAYNPFALRTTNTLAGVTNNFSAVSNLLGCWVFNYQTNFHNTNSKSIFTNKFVPARFGAPYTTKTYGTNTVAGRYQLVIGGRRGTNSIQDGYDLLHHIADLPFTQEYISIKLCRLFVHDNFPNPSNDPSNPLYSFYDYTSGHLSAEAQLVRNCMLMWDNVNPKGQIRDVLRVIFNSDLFRSQQSAAQKVKTPLEFVVSAVRAMRISTNGEVSGTYTADTDGYSFATPMSRMGGMNLFDRGDPDGYPETAPGWISAGTLAERVRFVQSLCIAFGNTGHSGAQSGTGNDATNSVCNPVELLKRKLPAPSWMSAADVADYFLRILYPGEGAGNLQLYRQAAINYLNTSDTGADSPFDILAISSGAANYDTRVRGMVGMLMSLPRFQEQ